MRYFEGKVVLLTGANGGLGSEMARQLDAAGARLILADLAAVSRTKGDHVLGYLQCDVSRAEGCDELVRAAKNLGPRIDVLINNAGVASVGDFVDIPDDTWEAQIAINLVAPMRLTKLLLPAMLAAGSGHIVNISSLGGFVPTPGATTYAATKFGLRGFGTGLSDEVRVRGVTVSNVYPSFTRTPLIDAERFGDAAPGAVPSFLISEPEPIVRSILRGVASRRLHVYPTVGDWLVARLVGVSPVASQLLTRLLLRVAG